MRTDIFIADGANITCTSTSCSMALHMDPSDPKGSDKNQVNLPIVQAQEQHQQSG